MTSEKDLKRLVRARMEKTGESYTSARAQLLKKPAPSRTSTRPGPPDTPRLSSIPGATATTEKRAGMSNERILQNSGRTWDEWVRLLDAEGAVAMPHRQIAQVVSGKFGVGPWWTQAVAVGYERIKGLRAIGQRRDGSYEASKSRTFDVPVATLFDAFADPATRRRWLDAKDVRVRTATRPRTMRLGMSDGTIVAIGFTAKGARSSVAVQHTKLKDRATADRLRKYWNDQMDALAALLKKE